MAGFLERLPKVDLHLHLEGSLSRRVLEHLARRHRRPVPAVHRFSDFNGFLKSFGEVCDLLVDSEDFDLAASELLRRCRQQRLAHVEIIFSPQVFLRRGIPLAAIMDGLMKARRGTRGISSVYIMDGVRQWGGEWFEQTVRAVEPYVNRGVAAIGLGGRERALPIEDFARAYARGRAMGLRTTIHAGEASGPDSVRSALRYLRVDRIGHGIRAIEDPSLVAELAARRVPLEICPSSNLLTGVVSSIESHPVRRLYESGVAVTIGSDDGLLFGTNLARELELVSRRFGFSRDEIGKMTLNAASAAFLPRSARARLRRRIRSSLRSCLLG